eukprot:TRINITY_DN2203_c0_g1_i19.p1 TRINITY_DN2203_c0_g1~~TRINITY_DN2203_c0_g1_i19.p1  ORF type:complete len:116 (-),score=15.14 TRINITY_DN2203_c0_g1_i19:705-1052(-)
MITLGRIPPHLLAALKDFLSHATRDLLVADNSALNTLSWTTSASGNLSHRDAWHLLRIKATELPWTSLIWNKFVNPRLAGFSLRLPLRKTPTNSMAKNRGSQLASRCYNCHLSDE